MEEQMDWKHEDTYLTLRPNSRKGVEEKIM